MEEIIMMKIEFEGIPSFGCPNETLTWVKRTDVQPIEATCWKSNEKLRGAIINFINTPEGKEHINKYGGIPIKCIEEPTEPKGDEPIIGRVIKIYDTHALIGLKKSYLIPTPEDILNKFVLCIDGKGSITSSDGIWGISDIYARLAIRAEECVRMINQYNIEIPEKIKCPACGCKCNSKEQTQPEDLEIIEDLETRLDDFASIIDTDSKTYILKAEIRNLKDFEVIVPGIIPGQKLDISSIVTQGAIHCTANVVSGDIDYPKVGTVYMSNYLYDRLGLEYLKNIVAVKREIDTCVGKNPKNDVQLKSFKMSNCYKLKVEVNDDLKGFNVVIPGVDSGRVFLTGYSNRDVLCNIAEMTTIENPEIGKVYMGNYLYDRLNIAARKGTVVVEVELRDD